MAMTFRRGLFARFSRFKRILLAAIGDGDRQLGENLQPKFGRTILRPGCCYFHRFVSNFCHRIGLPPFTSPPRIYTRPPTHLRHLVFSSLSLSSSPSHSFTAFVSSLLIPSYTIS